MTSGNLKWKLSIFSGGTRHQPARPLDPQLDESLAAQELEDAVAEQFREAREETRLGLDLRPTLRQIGKRVLESLSAQILASAPPVRGGVPGGSLSREILRASNLSLRRTALAVKAGRYAGLRLGLWGAKVLTKQVEDLAIKRLKATKGSKSLLRDMEDLLKRAQEAKRSCAEAKVA